MQKSQLIKIIYTVINQQLKQMVVKMLTPLFVNIVQNNNKTLLLQMQKLLTKYNSGNNYNNNNNNKNIQQNKNINQLKQINISNDIIKQYQAMLDDDNDEPQLDFGANYNINYNQLNETLNNVQKVNHDFTIPLPKSLQLNQNIDTLDGPSLAENLPNFLKNCQPIK